MLVILVRVTRDCQDVVLPELEHARWQYDMQHVTSVLFVGCPMRPCSNHMKNPCSLLLLLLVCFSTADLPIVNLELET